MTESAHHIGVLALQGSFAEHSRALRRLGAEPVEVRLPADLNRLAGFILPGGESTTILKLMDTYGLREPICAAAQRGMPVLGTCAGVVCLSRQISSHHMQPLGLIDISVARNAFGRQVESFEEDLTIAGLEGPSFRGVFIRAPIIDRCGSGVEVLSRLRNGTVVACRQNAIVVTSFHPEFVDDLRMHEYFLRIVRDRAGALNASAADGIAGAALPGAAATVQSGHGRG
jgi:5'-phosphate synthase pdxT subunit